MFGDDLLVKNLIYLFKIFYLLNIGHFMPWKGYVRYHLPSVFPSSFVKKKKCSVLDRELCIVPDCEVTVLLDLHKSILCPDCTE